MLLETRSQPDILEVIADLSNDEVFTPPRVVNAVLDLLPEHVWSDPSLRWLDPGTKTGVFLREATKRLMEGLSSVIVDEQERLDHILTNMTHGIAVTELTALMARRTVYCSKDATGPHSTVRMPEPEGNIWLQRVEHGYSGTGRCVECGAAESQMERENRDNYAYAFIHTDGRAKLAKEMHMKFDVIVGNPPYQMTSDGGTRDMPIYHLFMEQAKALNPQYIAFIMPSRWMASGLGLSEFRATMLSDRRIRRLVDYPVASELFPGVEVKGGVSYLLWDRDNEGDCEVTTIRGGASVGPALRNLGEYDVLVRDTRALAILHKVQAQNEPSITDILSVDKEFGWTSNFDGFHKARQRDDVPIYYVRSGKRLTGWIARSDVSKSAHLIDTWKMMIPQAGSDGGQRLPDVVLGNPFIAPSPSVCTQTYLFFYVTSQAEAESVESYLRTRFFRFLVSLRKITQHATRSTYLWVPQQSWDREWTDDELCTKYGITVEEQAYISEAVKEMPA